ncbi:MAG: diacylglycerol kinase [Nevskiales bacterium]
MPKPGKTGLIRIIDAQMYTIKGLRAIWKHEAAFRQECALAAVMVPAAFWVGTDAVQVAMLVGVCLIVLIVELLNSAVETVVDRVGEEMHELSGRAKDMGSAAVFVSLCLAGLTWILILWQRFA